MARAARLSGNIDEEEQELEELMEEQRNAEHLVCATAVSAFVSHNFSANKNLHMSECCHGASLTELHVGIVSINSSFGHSFYYFYPDNIILLIET